VVARPVTRGRLPSPRLVDLAVVGGLLAADVVGQVVVTAGGRASSPPLTPLGVAVAALSAGVFWWRRSHPLLVFVASVVALGVASGAVHPGLLTQHAGVPLVIAVYGAGAWSGHRRRAVALAGALAVLAFSGLSKHPHTTALQAAAVAMVLVALPFVAGLAARSRRAYIEEVEGRLAAAERDRDEQSRRAAADERRHIARELHDLVAHHVSLIGVQAGAARTALDGATAGSEHTRRALLAIEQSSRSAVGEMRQLLDALRGEDGAAELQPPPGVSRLDALLEDFRTAGLGISVSVRGDPGVLSPLQDLCCYRLIEEALTNVTRHSMATGASVSIGIDDRRVSLEVEDPGPARTQSGGTGRGLVGLRERVELSGGVLIAGPTDAGFRVHASMPLLVS
jgi:signal transduction histidine kinase